jgi:hypothetical protein
VYGFLLALAVAAAIFFAGWWQGSSGKRALERAIEAAVEKRRADIADLTVYFSNRDTAAREQFALERGRDQLLLEDLKAKVPTYVTPKADRACVVPRGFVLHHDAAWRGTPLPEAAGGSVDADSGIPLSRVAGVNTDNAGTCRELRAEVVFWRKWYPDTQARWDAFARGTEGKPQTLPATKGR